MRVTWTPGGADQRNGVATLEGARDLKGAKGPDGAPNQRPQQADLCAASARFLAALENRASRILLAGAVEWSNRVVPAPKPSVWRSEAHTFFEIAYLDSGESLIVADGEGYVLRAGDVCIIPPSQVHYEAPIPPGNKGYDSCWMWVAPPKAGFQFARFEAASGRICIVDRITLTLSDGTLDLVRQAADELRSVRPYSLSAARGFLTVVAARVSREVAAWRERAGAESWGDPVVREVVRFLHENYHRPDLTVGDMARLVALSPNYFSVYFKARTGCSPYRYLLELRLERGRELLAHADRSVAGVAEAVGFSSPYHFSTTFKRYFGVSPSEYRDSVSVRTKTKPV